MAPGGTTLWEMLHTDFREHYFLLSWVTRVPKVSLPLRSPLGRFEGPGEVPRRALDLAVLNVDYLAHVHAVAIVVERHLDDSQVTVYLVARVDQVQYAWIVIDGSRGLLARS